MARSCRRGNILVMVGVLGLVIFTAVFALNFLTRTDVVSSSNLLREIVATNIADSIAAQVEARVNTHLWADRFWYLDAVKNLAVATRLDLALKMDTSSPYLDLSNEAIAASDYDFEAVVKDLPSGEANLKEYRIYVEVTVKGERYGFTYDKRHESSMLATLNFGSTHSSKALEVEPADPPPDSPVTQTVNDSLMSQVKKDEDDADPPDTSAAAVKNKIKKLKEKEPVFKTRCFPGKPAKAPGPVTQTGNVIWVDPTGGTGTTYKPNGQTAVIP